MTLAQLVLLSKEDQAAHDPKKRRRAERGTAADLMMFSKMGAPRG